MIRMLIVGYVFAIRSERQLCREVQVNLAYRWFCGLSIEDKIPDHSAFSGAADEVPTCGTSDGLTDVLTRAPAAAHGRSSIPELLVTMESRDGTSWIISGHTEKIDVNSELLRLRSVLPTNQ
jgi:hypothetical protein